MRLASSSSVSCRLEAAVRWGVKGRPSRFAPGYQVSSRGRFRFHSKANAEWLRWASQPALPRRSTRPSPPSRFTLEEIIGDLDQTMLSGVIVAAAIAAAVERGILGQHPVFEIQRQYSLGQASSLVWYAVLGILSAVAAVAFTDSLLGLRIRFKSFTSVPKWAHPAVGGALTGGAGGAGSPLAETERHHWRWLQNAVASIGGIAFGQSNDRALPAEAGGDGVLLQQRRGRRNFCAFIVYRWNAGRRLCGRHSASSFS